MILGNRIEEAALKGKCIWRTINLGYSSTYTIPVPLGSFILLRQIIVYPFIPFEGEERNPAISQCVFQIVLNEQGLNQELTYIVRNSRIPAGNAVASRDHPSSPQNIETWATFRKACTIDVRMQPNAAAAIYAANDDLAPNAQERGGGLGYENVPGGVIPAITIDANTKVYPTGESRPFGLTPYAGANVIDRVRTRFNAAGQIPPVNPADTIHADFQYPLFTFGYWEFKGATPESLV
jgi:hypothetical protein